MLRYCASAIYFIVMLPTYLDWSHHQIETQAVRTKQGMFHLSGVDTRVPSDVIFGGVTLLVSHHLISRHGLLLTRRQTWLSLLVGCMVGLCMFYWDRPQRLL